MLQTRFFDIALEAKALRFGEFTLKSGRISPYFFNAGLFNDGQKLYQLATCYAQCIIEKNIQFDVLFGPAYKGIPLVALVSAILYEVHGRNVGFCYNRKEQKDHGEGGILVGSDIKNKRVLIIDDLITAGTAIKQAIGMIQAAEAGLSGVVVALDREEVASNQRVSAIQAIEDTYQFPVFSVASLSAMIQFMKTHGAFSKDEIQRIEHYQAEYGVKQ
ncbi:orotate phosphoribosyltransferase [Fangia hongkongensis]|uniref:orotate phosphoribosyltransferase n=1 Tax=Fangia hongkongensis TaxID=270495 RepID=UPI00037DD444|nr:orotate phosphoribosyltransferase [Fangia hongkongensis]MBK2124735.1 orotate phosphoribosyltransferase [Fangia hongkongensis]